MKHLTIDRLLEHKLLLMVIIFVGLFLRFYKYDSIPFGINHDSSAVALEAIDISQNPFPYRPYSKIDWKGETLILYLLALPIKVFGHSPSNIKLYSTVISCLLLPIFYLLVREIFGSKIATSSLLFLSLSGWHIIMGKTAWPAILLPITECIFFYFIYRTIIYKYYRDGALAGLSLALVMNSYSAAKFVPIYFIIILLFLFLKYRKKVNKKNTLLFIMFCLSFAIFITPLAIYIKNNWVQYTSRSSSVFIGNRTKEAGNFIPLRENIIQTINMHLVKANGNDFFVNEPLLDSLSSFYFVLGLCSLLFFIKNIKYMFVLLGFLLSLTPGLVSVPNGNRGIGSLPFVYLIAGIGLYNILKLTGKFKQYLAILLFFAVFIITLFVTFNIYLGKNRIELFGFYPETTIVGNYIKQKLSQYDFYITDGYPRDALTFLTYQTGNPFIRNYTWKEEKKEFLQINQKNKGLIFVMFNNPENQYFISSLKQKFPGGETSELRYIDGSINRSAALIYKITK